MWIPNTAIFRYNCGMTSTDNITDNQQQDTPRQSAPSGADFSLSIEEAAVMFERADVARSPRTISRYCENGYLDCTKMETDRNVKYLISSASAQRRIKELQSIIAATRTSPVVDTTSHNLNQQDTSNYHDTTRHDESFDDIEQKLKQLTSENQDLKVENRDLKGSIERDKIYIERIEKQNDSLFDIVHSLNDKFFATMNMMSRMLQAPQTRAAPSAESEPLDVPHHTPPPAVQPAEHSPVTTPDDIPLSLNQS